MNKSVGKIIRVIAVIMGCIALIVGIILALANLTDELSQNDLTGWIGLAGGIVLAIASVVMYGFGQQIEDVRAIRYKLERTDLNTNSTSAPVQNDELPEL